MADTAPIVPTMKYWNTLLPVSPLLDLYLAKEGMLVVLLPPRPLKGLSKEEDAPETSAMDRRCWWVVTAEARTREGRGWREQLRARAPVLVVRGGIVGEGDQGGEFVVGRRRMRGCQKVGACKIWGGLSREMPEAASSPVIEFARHLSG